MMPLTIPTVPALPASMAGQAAGAAEAGSNEPMVCMVQATPLEERLERRRVTTTSDLPKRDFLFLIHGTPCFPRGEIVAVTGKAKSGKTFVCSILMAASLSGEAVGVARAATQPYKVVWIDTEQSEESTQDILLRRVYPMANNCPEIDEWIEVFNLRADNWQERLPLVETAVRAIQPDLVIFDGIRDVVNDINDGKQAQEVVERVMQLAGQVMASVVCVLHQNKAAEDSTLRGALGTELQNKCFECYECKKDPDTLLFDCKQTLTRKYDLRDSLTYSVNTSGIPVAVGGKGGGNGAYTGAVGGSPNGTIPGPQGTLPRLGFAEKYSDENGRLRLRELFIDVFADVSYLNHQEMEKRCMDLLQCSSFRFYNQARNTALEQQIIERHEGVHSWYTLTRQELPVQ